jgi:Flp pilus assembly protein TadG
MTMAPASFNGILIPLRRFLRDRRGLSAVEFALLLPVMLTLFLGGTEVTQGITVKRKTTIVTRALGDLVAQDTSITNSEMTTIFQATNSIVAPFSSTNLKVIVSSIAIDANNAAKIVWSDATNGATAHAAGLEITLPEGLNQFPNTTLIWVESQYDYTPAIGYVITGLVPLKDHVYLRPRLVRCVERDKGAEKFC